MVVCYDEDESLHTVRAGCLPEWKPLRLTVKSKMVVLKGFSLWGEQHKESFGPSTLDQIASTTPFDHRKPTETHR